MFFDPFEVTTVHIIYALLGAFIVLSGMFSLFLREKLYRGEAIWAFVFGVIMGPYAANIFDPRAWGNSSNPDEPIDVITIEFTRVVLAIGVFAIGVELPKAYMAKHWKSLFFLLVPGMIWGWFVCAGLIYALIPGLDFLSSLAVSACLTPTDPILASAVVGGKWADKHVPAHLRHLLAAESACNDGAAFPFLFFALYLMIDLPSVGNAMRDWFVILWLYQVILGVIIGSFLGFAFRHLMKFCQRHDLIDRHSYVAQYLSLAILTIGLTTLLGCDDLLAAFACGTSFAWDGFFNKQTEESVFSSVIDTLFNVAAFVFLGAWIPFGQFHLNVQNGMNGMGAVQVWRLVVLAILVLLLRRLPIMMAMYRWIPDVKTWREAVFSGHFGPMGIGAIFISTLANQFLVQYLANNPSGADQHQLEMVKEMIQPIVAFMVICSITIHGLSIPGFSLGRRVHSVSRTWSRRDTMGNRAGAPDWTNQARLVTRAEDIVINRDLERGDEERGGERTTKRISMSTINKEGEGSTSDAVNQEQRDPIPASTRDQDQDDCRNQFPPDGKHNQTREWMEGDQRVVERNMGGPGDDVCVFLFLPSFFSRF
jgi:NhaP-type Na+/H+ or K+/H+ antiporter